MKQAYIRSYDGYSWDWKKVELTGLCKKVSGGPHGDREYVQIRSKFFWLFSIKFWVTPDEVQHFDPETKVIYKCNCGETK